MRLVSCAINFIFKVTIPRLIAGGRLFLLRPKETKVFFFRTGAFGRIATAQQKTDSADFCGKCLNEDSANPRKTAFAIGLAVQGARHCYGFSALTGTRRRSHDGTLRG